MDSACSSAKRQLAMAITKFFLTISLELSWLLFLTYGGAQTSTLHFSLFHTDMYESAELGSAIPEPKERPEGWISTSFLEESADPTAKFCSADYQV